MLNGTSKNNYDYVCERDWKDEMDDFIYFMNNLKGTKQRNIEITSEWLHEKSNGSINEWCSYIDERLKYQELVVAAIDINSDSYVMFICEKEILNKLGDLSNIIGHKIDLASKM